MIIREVKHDPSAEMVRFLYCMPVNLRPAWRAWELLEVGKRFDVDRLVEVAEGSLIQDPEALAPGSYHVAGQKTKDGQEHLPKPVGTVWLANGLYPGWQVGEKPSFTDPREPAPSPRSPGPPAEGAGSPGRSRRNRRSWRR